MSMTDPIADFLTRIRNGMNADFDTVEIPASRFKVELARILSEQGYIEGYSTEPGRRTYVNHTEIPKVLGGMGTAILTTSKGVMTGHEARRQGVGGEVIAYVW